jgi:AcrR family transcriptional regulator
MKADIGSTTKYQQQKAKAIEAAASVFASKGYHGASTKDIATHLGIRQGSLYYYFKSKEKALEEVCLIALKSYVGKMETIFEQELPIEEKLSMVVRAHLSSYRENNAALRVHNEQRLYLPKNRRDKLKDLGSTYRQHLEQIFINGVDKGKLRSDLDSHFAALSLIGLCNYWGSMLSRERGLSLDETIQKCTDITLYGCN